MARPDVLVIGAGPAGLATSRELARAGVAHTVLERGDGVAPHVDASLRQPRPPHRQTPLRAPGPALPEGHAPLPEPRQLHRVPADLCGDVQRACRDARGRLGHRAPRERMDRAHDRWRDPPRARPRRRHGRRREPLRAGAPQSRRLPRPGQPQRRIPAPGRRARPEHGYRRGRQLRGRNRRRAWTGGRRCHAGRPLRRRDRAAPALRRARFSTSACC